MALAEHKPSRKTPLPRHAPVLAADGHDVQVDPRCIRKDGSRIALRERISAIRENQGPPSSLLLSFEPSVR